MKTNATNDPLFVIETFDGATYSGRTISIALNVWRANCPHIPARSLAEWMRSQARRAEMWAKSGAAVRSDSPEHFVSDLEAAGQIKVRVAS